MFSRLSSATVVVVVVVCMLSTAEAGLPPLVVQFEKEIKSSAHKLPNLSSILFHLKHMEEIGGGYKMVSPISVGKFSWNDCGKPDDLFILKNLSVSPDPVVLPGTISIGFAFNVSKEFSSPLDATVLLEKKIGSKFIKVPCIAQFGSCHYDDLCSILRQIPQCPPEFIRCDIPCECPFKQGNYSLPDITFDLDAVLLPAGEYHAKIDASYLGKHVGCAEVYLDVKEE